VTPQKVFIPPELMDDIYAGRYVLGGGPLQSLADVRAERRDERQLRLFQINRLLQRLAPHLHHWNRSVFFGIRRLERDTGWTPEYTFPRMVEQTWEWMQRRGLDRSLEFDFSPEDELLAHLGA
jgi:nucleoside-diphosphate-sugar epimerase